MMVVGFDCLVAFRAEMWGPSPAAVLVRNHCTGGAPSVLRICESFNYIHKHQSRYMFGRTDAWLITCRLLIKIGKFEVPIHLF